MRKTILFIFFILFQLGCGQSNITFPQGPISGTGLFFTPTQVNIQPFSSITLTVDRDTIHDQFHFEWSLTGSLTCDAFAVIITPALNKPDFGVNQIVALQGLGQTTNTQLTTSPETVEFVRDNPGNLDAIVLCIQNNSTFPYFRSNFVELTPLL